MSFDAEAHRDASLEAWEEAAPGWVARQRMMREYAAPVSHWMIDAIAPQPGQRVLELAAGLGETALLSAELVAPMGGVVVSDQAEAMLAGARERAADLGLGNVEFKVLNAEWIDLPLASVDAVLCRWGYMLLADPATALGETRRVLRPGGRLAAAVWDDIDFNPWASLPTRELFERGLAPPRASGAPGPFALSDSERLAGLLAGAGFVGIQTEALELVRRHPDFDDLWETTLDLSRSFHDAVLERQPEEVSEIRASLAARFAPYTEDDGSLSVPARTLLARASA